MTCCSFRVRLINYLLKGTNIMTTIEDILTSMGEVVPSLQTLSASIDSIDTKTDEIKAFIATLKAGAVTQEQLDQLATLVASTKTATADAQTKAEKALGDVDALDAA